MNQLPTFQILAIAILIHTLLFLISCSSTVEGSPNGMTSTDASSPTPAVLHTTEADTSALVAAYCRAIGDYIRLAGTQYQIAFDTLYFGKHVYGQPDDFPDIVLPAMIDKVHIRLISPEEGEKIQKRQPSSYYVNLMADEHSNHADFTFITFRDRFVHQFDCFLSYVRDTLSAQDTLISYRFENYGFRKESSTGTQNGSGRNR